MYAEGNPTPIAPNLIVSRGGRWISRQTGQVVTATPNAGGLQAPGGWKPNLGTQPPGFNRGGATR
jgi:hypothetical protein